MDTPRNDRRHFQPVKVEVSGCESGKERFSGVEHFNPPLISSWRNNLTALSQRFNLYFVAVKDKIHVYVPEFPSQSIGNKPRLLLSPPPAEPSARGYLDPHNPHSINHIIIGDLGTDEVIVLATDSGNVSAYHTHAIAQAIARDASKFDQTPPADPSIRPFLTHWVFESAWGLAVHKAARMIAVSSNTPHHVESTESTAKITVFAFALSNQHSEDVSEDEDEDSDDSSDAFAAQSEEWMEIDDDDCDPDHPFIRNRNLKITLSGHWANIPNIAFVNNFQDPKGEWLVATDIDGDMMIWKVWDKEVFRSYDYSDISYGARVGRREVERGWSVLPLDPASFRTMTTMEEFCGKSDPSEYYPPAGASDVGSPREAYLLNGAELRLPRASARSDIDSDDESEQASISDDISEDDDAETGGVPLLVNGDRIIESNVVETDQVNDDSEDIDQSLEEGSIARSADRSLSRNIDTEVRNRHSQLDLEILLSADRFRGSANTIDRGASTVTLTETISVNDDNEDRSDDGGAIAALLTPPRQLLSPQSQLDGVMSETHFWRPTGPSYQRVPQIPIMHFSASNVRLTSGITASVPHLFLSDPCLQYFPPALSWMSQMDRLNMTAYIPELGVVIAASQAGKVAVISLTKRAETGCFGCRVDWTLPFKEQLNSYEQPALLLGIAVSPLSGHADPVEDTGSKISHQSNDQVWASDGVIDGVTRSFNPAILDLSPRMRRPSISSHESDDNTIQPQPPPVRRSSRQSSKKKTTPPRRRKPTPTTSPTPLQQPTPPRTQTRPQAKTLRTNSSIAQNVPQDKKDKPRYPLITAPWPHASAGESSTSSISAIGGSKRYRLLLTYYDHTVLSYEISRTEDRIGLWGSGRRNWRNRDEMRL